MHQPRKKRRLFSFSLRTLLIAVLLLSCLFGWIGIRYRRMKEQRAVLDWIEASNSTAFIGDDEFRPSNRDLFWDGNCIQRIDRVSHDDVGAFYRGYLHTNDVTPLAELKGLKELELSISQIADLSPLSGLKNLQVLDIAHTKVTDLAPLSGLKHLRLLKLEGCSVKEKDIKKLKKALPNCRIRN